jgi:hypothetical protein
MTLRRLASLASQGLIFGVASVVAVACFSNGDDGDSQGADLSAGPPRTLAIDEDISVLVEHPETLKALETQGFDLGTRLGGAAQIGANNVAFAASAEGRAITAAVEGDVAAKKKADKGAHPTFDPSWLHSSEGSFQLVAIANRLDRRHATPDACGEVHLVYRLAYANAKAKSRLPMTMMLVYPQEKSAGDCADVAKRWTDAAAAGSDPTSKAAALATGPLAKLALAPKVELNFQLVRWPSTTRQDMGGHAEYSLRVFERGASGLAPVQHLENALREDLNGDEQKALGEWISANVADIDRGTAKVPAEFLPDHVTSVSPKGLARGHNRPFAIYFGKDGGKLPPIELGGTSLVTSKAALLRRLDTMTCNGCHQSQGLAGFHALGTDPAETSSANALAIGISPHLREQVAYRKTDLASVAAGKMELAPLPFAEHGSDQGLYGAACGLGDPGFATWKCGKDFVCSDDNGDQVGICVSKARRSGEACEESKVTFTADPTQDKVTMGPVMACVNPNGAGGACVRSGGNPGGFPNGMCTGGCNTVGQVVADAMCGVSVPDGFNACIAKGGLFEDCVANGTTHWRKACSAKIPCGPDYVCAAVAHAPPSVGACMPPYFIFQARVDGHHVGK